MDKIIIVFPLNAGGNHLKNLIEVNSDNFVEYKSLYLQSKNSVHTRKDKNLIEQDLDTNLMHGHFGEIMSFQTQIRAMRNKRFISISPDTYEDRKILSERFDPPHSLELDSYYDYEQVFLYEPFMFHYYFNVSMDDIMNISVHELFQDNINNVIDRLNFFLRRDLSREHVNELHRIWRQKNKDYMTLRRRNTQ
jgi:hypothetical protein